jgi:O-antigen/teichoic acid export membrane protein
MDLNTIVIAGSRIVGLIATPIVIYLGYGVVGAVSVLLGASLLCFGGHVLFASRLVKGIGRIGYIKVEAAGAMMNFGGPLVIAAATAMVVANIEKVILPMQVSLEALAYYTVAFTLASMMALFSQAMVQSLIPAFSQLQGPNNREQLNGLYTRGLRLNLIILLPTIAILIVAAKPFLTIWAGREYADQGIVPFYILLCGLLFNLPAFLPYAIIMAAGRSSIFAKLYVTELVPYIFVVYYLTSHFGIVGAATAWSLRIAIDAGFQFYLARRFGGIPGKELNIPMLACAGLVLIVPIVASLWFDDSLVLTIPLLLMSVTAYLIFVWSRLLDVSEIQWMKAMMHRMITGFR